MRSGGSLAGRPRRGPILVLRALAATLVVGIVAWVAGCGGGRHYISQPGPYDRLAGVQLATFERARAATEVGRLEEARELLDGLARAVPENIAVGAFLQDVELELLAQGEPVPGVYPIPPPDRVGDRLFRRQLARTEADPTPANLVLAARLEQDAEAALHLLDRARELDPDCIWVHYGTAYVLLREGDLAGARAAIDAAFELDGGHVPTRRLEASVLARAGETGRATRAYESWLDDTAGDPRVGSPERYTAQLDLAQLLIVGDEPEDALDVLGRAHPATVEEEARRVLLKAAAQEATGDLDAALASVARARALVPNDLLPVVQEGFLHARAGDAEAERASWEELLERTSLQVEEEQQSSSPSGVELQGLVMQLLARTRLARLDEAAARAALAADGGE